MTQVPLTLPEKRLRVLMITEGTYPFHWGGVSTWCHLLLQDLPNVDFELFSLAASPDLAKQFSLPANVVAFHHVPLWGIREILENQPNLTIAALRDAKHRTTSEVILHRFVPLFAVFVQELFVKTLSPTELGQVIHAMHRFFLKYDFDATMRSQAVWRCFVQTAQESFPQIAAQNGYPDAQFHLADLSAAMQWLYHWFFPIAAPLPKADIAHAAMVGICTLVAVVAKYEHGAAIMLTEHGIYLRERYLAEATSENSLFLKLFSLCFARRMTELTYGLADQISPCCDANQRWELRNGAKREQIRTIYYGVDSSVFTPVDKPFGDPPVVVWVGRIDPLKDLLTLIRAAAVVHRSRPDIEFRLFGSAPAGNEAYYEKCLELRRELGLEQTVIFAGFRANTVAAFNEGDIVVLSSVSEAFPFVVLEAMLCEKPVVATGVGGVPEQVAGCGFAIEPRNPEAMAEAILKLMNDPELCATLGKAARAKAMSEFSMHQSGQAHNESYQRLAKQQQALVAQARNKQPVRLHPLQQRLLLMQQTLTKSKNGISGNGHYRNGQHSNGNGTYTLRMGAPHTHAYAKGVHTCTTYTNTRENGHRENGFYPPQNTEARDVVQKDNRSLHTAMVVPTPMINGNGHHSQPTPQTHGHRAATLATTVRSQSQAENTQAFAALAAEVAQRDRQPIDALEITAIIESMGVTDVVATQRYRAANAFELGEALFAHIKQTVQPAPLWQPQPIPPIRWKEALRDLVRGPMSLLPALILLLCIFTYSSVGQWESNWVLALSAGMTASMLLTNGFIQAMSRRTSIYLGLGKRLAAGQFLWRSTMAVGACLLGVVGLAAVVTVQLGLFSRAECLIFTLAFLGLSALWLAAGGLSLVQRADWVIVAMISGLLAGILADWIGTYFFGWRLIAGTIIGYSVAMLLIVRSLRRGYADNQTDNKPAKTQKQLRVWIASVLATMRADDKTAKVKKQLHVWVTSALAVMGADNKPAKLKNQLRLWIASALATIRKDSKAAKAKKPLRLPALAYMLHEAAPLFVYGFSYMAFILLPHILGWLGALGVHQVRAWAVTSVEVGMTLSMPPIIIANGVAEFTLRRFWRYAPALQSRTPAKELHQFQNALVKFYRQYAMIYLITLVIWSVITKIFFQLAIDAGWIEAWLGRVEMAQPLFIFHAGLIAYGLLGLGVFSCMFCITLNAPQLALRAVLWGIVVTILVGIPLSNWYYTYSSVAFICGAFVFVIVAWRMCHQVLRSADYRFAMAL